MPGDLLAGAQDHDLVDEALHHNILEAVCRRHRVVVAAVADQGRRRDPRRPLLARLQRHGGQIPEGLQVGDETLADGLAVATGAFALSAPAALFQHGVEIVEARRQRDRRHEVRSGILHQPLDLALVVALAGTAKAVAEQVVALTSSVKARVRSRLPSPQIFATAIVVLS